MSILQSTFDKHKKLMLESVGMINETELYHAADKDQLESFKSGIDISKAGTKFDGAGANQGKGFYVYSNKNDAYNHAKENGQELVVVIDQALNADDFDVDTEGEYQSVIKFIGDNWDFFVKNWKSLGIQHHVLKNQPPTNNGVCRISFDGARTPTFNANTNSSMPIGKDEGPTLIWKMVQEWKKIDLVLFQKFENENLKNAKVLKYNGEKKIFPVRIEDLQGNILWQNKK